VMVLVMTSGAILVMWMGELITEKGIGNGMSLLIFAGIATRLPTDGLQILQNNGGLVFAMVVVGVVILVAGIPLSSRGSAASQFSMPSAWSAVVSTVVLPPTCR